MQFNSDFYKFIYLIILFLMKVLLIKIFLKGNYEIMALVNCRTFLSKVIKSYKFFKIINF